MTAIYALLGVLLLAAIGFVGFVAWILRDDGFDQD